MDRAQRSCGLTSLPGWQLVTNMLEQTTELVGATAFSLGVLRQDRILTFNRGFSDRTSTLFSTIPADLDLPGAAVLQSQASMFLTTSAETQAQFPLTAEILFDTSYEAAACVPLFDRGSQLLGYVAYHYPDERSFSVVEQRRLERAASGVAKVLAVTLRDIRSNDIVTTAAGPPEVGLDVQELQAEVLHLRTALTSRATIEQAKGMVMLRFDVDAEHAWQLLLRWSMQQDRKVRDIAKSLVDGSDRDLLR